MAKALKDAEFAALENTVRILEDVQRLIDFNDYFDEYSNPVVMTEHLQTAMRDSPLNLEIVRAIIARERQARSTLKC